MKLENFQVDIPAHVLEKWKEIVNFLAQVVHVPVALVTRVESPNIRVLVSSDSEENPFKAGGVKSLDRLYCETVMKTRQPLLVPDAANGEEWKLSPIVKLGMISYFGLPLLWPDGEVFGTICILDSKKNEYSELCRHFLTQCRDAIQADLATVERSARELSKQTEHLDQLFTRFPEAMTLVGPDTKIQRINPAFTKLFGYTEEEAVGRSLVDLIAPEELRAQIEENRFRVSLQGEILLGETVRQGKDGRRIALESLAVPVVSAGAPNSSFAIYRDITERKRLEDASRCERDRLRLLLEVTNLKTSRLDLRSLIGALSSHVSNALRCDHWGLLLPDPECSQFRNSVLYHSDERDSLYDGMTVPIEQSISGRAFRTRETLRVKSFETVREDAEVSGNSFAQRFYARLVEDGFQSACYIPLLSRERAVGVLAVFKRSASFFDEDEAAFLEQVAHPIAAAIENALLRGKATAGASRPLVSFIEEVSGEHIAADAFGADDGLKSVLEEAEFAAAADCSVLILGENGAGRELIARAIHDSSSRCGRGFVKINCASTSLGMLESEIFEHEKAAVTGLVVQNPGSLDLADKGTLFLDEVGNLPPVHQARVLRVLEERELKEPGGNRTHAFDVRIIAAHPRDLAAMVKEKSFCAKLYDRLKAFTIRIPALRDQAQDIPELMWDSLDRPARGTQMRFRPEAVAVLNADTFKTHEESPLQRSLHTSSVPKTALIRILIVDSQPIYQKGLRIVLEAQPDMLVVGEVTTAIEAVAEFRHHKPDVTLMGHCVKSLAGLDADPFLTIRAEFPRAHIVILSTADGEAGIRGALKAGAASYVLKDAPPKELLEIVRSVYRGQKSIPSAVAARLAEHPGSEDLTPRELDVLQLIRDGSKNKQIADKLSISQTTVTFHIRNIMDKLQADDRTHAVTVALRRGHLLLQ